MKFNCCKSFSKSISLIIYFISFFFLNGNFLNAENLLEELQIDSSTKQIDSSTKTEENNSPIPTNPFQIMEMMRRYSSLNDATSPSDALDDALNTFNSLEEKQEI